MNAVSLFAGRKKEAAAGAPRINTSQQEFSMRIQPVNPISGLSKKQISELKRMTRKGSAKKESNTFDIMVEEAMVSDAETGA